MMKIEKVDRKSYTPRNRRWKDAPFATLEVGEGFGMPKSEIKYGAVCVYAHRKSVELNKRFSVCTRETDYLIYRVK